MSAYRAQPFSAILPSADAAAQQLVTAEAKMFSGLSSGTKNAKGFDQAARNVACIAEVVSKAGRSSDSLQRLGFVVLAPGEQIRAGAFGSVNKATILDAVRVRVSAYAGNSFDTGGADAAAKLAWFEQEFCPTCEILRVDVLAWEDVVKYIASRDNSAGEELGAFLGRCLEHNRPLAARGRAGAASPIH